MYAIESDTVTSLSTTNTDYLICPVDVSCTQTQHGRTITIFLAPGDQLESRAHADGTVEVFENSNWRSAQ